MHTTSASLLERLRQPAEQESWTRFVKLYTPLIFYWARRTGLQEEDAADLVQEVFTLLVKKLPEFQYAPGKSFRGWLRTVTLNKWRERQRRRVVAAAGGEQPPEPVADADDEAFWETEYRQQVFARAFELMQSEFQPATWKACWEQVVAGKPAGVVAAELGMTAGAVRAAKFRVLCRLRKEFEGMLD
jgi:RNA polymerase sigma-70 factor (ECF subfamily)